MIPYLGDFAEDATVYMVFNTFTSDDPSASCTITNFINTDVHIHKDNGLTQRNNAAGITVSVDFDGITGSHMIVIDTSDDTVGGFWVTGSDYFVRIEGTTVDGATINAFVGHFSIENRYNAIVDYDPPTKAEMDTAHALLATVAKQDVIDGIVDNILTDTNELQSDDIPGTLATIVAYLDTEIVAILADTDELQTDWANGGRLDLLIDELTTQGDTNEGKIDTVDTVADGIQTDLSNATDGLGALKALIDTIDGIVDAILVDSNELQTDWTNGGRLDLLIDAIKACTDRLTDARATELDVGTAGKMAYQLDKMMIALVNKLKIKEAADGSAAGSAEMFSDADVSLGEISAAFATDGTHTTRKRLVI